MSFCPTRDIHSVYLDNELPEAYKAEYEAHIANCPACKAELEKFKKLRGVFQSDAKSITPDAHYLDESFERLQVKMKFAKNTGINKKQKFNFNNISYAVSAVAAAAVFAVVLPVGFKAGHKAVQVVEAASSLSEIPFISSIATNVSFDSGRSKVISGNIDGAVLSPASVSPKNNQRVQNVVFNGNEIITNVESLKQNRNGDETISIKITVPGMNAVPVVTEINLPMDVISGRF